MAINGFVQLYKAAGALSALAAWHSLLFVQHLLQGGGSCSPFVFANGLDTGKCLFLHLFAMLHSMKMIVEAQCVSGSQCLSELSVSALRCPHSHIR